MTPPVCPRWEGPAGSVGAAPARPWELAAKPSSYSPCLLRPLSCLMTS